MSDTKCEVFLKKICGQYSSEYVSDYVANYSVKSGVININYFNLCEVYQIIFILFEVYQIILICVNSK